MNDPIPAADYIEAEDPAKFLSEKTGRGNLKKDWKTNIPANTPMMCAYKLVTVEFKWFGLQSRVEKFIQSVSWWSELVLCRIGIGCGSSGTSMG